MSTNGRTWTPDASTAPISILELFPQDHFRGKPTFKALREEGLSQHAIETLVIGRECLCVDMTPGAAAERLAADDYDELAQDVAAFLRNSHVDYPVDVEEVWPDGVPAHWCACETGAGVAACTVHAGYDPTDAELEVAWNGPDAPEAHRAAWRLHQETHNRSAS